MDLTLLFELSFFTFGLLYPSYNLEIILMYVFTHINPLNAELNPICHFLALLRAHPILHVSRIRVNDHGVFDDTGIHYQNQLLIPSIIIFFLQQDSEYR